MAEIPPRLKAAVKVLRPELSASISAERFLREIQISANLNHPHILTLIDSGEGAPSGISGFGSPRPVVAQRSGSQSCPRMDRRGRRTP